MLNKGDLVLALNHRLYTSKDISKAVCYKRAIILNVYHCENVPLDEPYRVLVDLVFEDKRIARFYFADHLVKIS